MNLLIPHIKEEEDGLGVLRNGVSPGRAPGERDRQITNYILPNLLSYSRRDLVAPIQALLQIWGRSLQPYLCRLVGWGQRVAELGTQDTPHSPNQTPAPRESPSPPLLTLTPCPASAHIGRRRSWPH